MSFQGELKCVVSVKVSSLSTMDTEERDQELVEQAYIYLTSTTYPPGCDENRKRVIRKKAKKFELKDGELYYKQKQKSKVCCFLKK